MTSPDDAFPVTHFLSNNNKQRTARISGLNIQNGGLNNDNASRPISFLASIIHDILSSNLVLGTKSVKICFWLLPLLIVLSEDQQEMGIEREGERHAVKVVMNGIPTRNTPPG